MGSAYEIRRAAVAVSPSRLNPTCDGTRRNYDAESRRVRTRRAAPPILIPRRTRPHASVGLMRPARGPRGGSEVTPSTTRSAGRNSWSAKLRSLSAVDGGDQTPRPPAHRAITEARSSMIVDPPPRHKIVGIASALLVPLQRRLSGSERVALPHTVSPPENRPSAHNEEPQFRPRSRDLARYSAYPSGAGVATAWVAPRPCTQCVARPDPSIPAVHRARVTTRDE